MIVNYFGAGCFRLQSGDVSLLVDPSNNRLKGDVVLRTLIPANIEAVSPSEIGFPGEYEAKGMEIQGWPVPSESTGKILKSVFLVRWEEMSFAFLGHLSKPLEPEFVEKLAEPDVLFLPFDGEHFLPGESAARLVKQINPHFVIPSFYKNAAEVGKVFGQRVEVQDKLVFKKKDLSEKQRQLKAFVLKAA